MKEKIDEHYPVKRHYYKPQDLPDWIDESTKSEKKKSRHKKDTKALMKKMNLGVVAPGSIEIEGVETYQEQKIMSAQGRVVTDCIADKIMKKSNCYYLKKGEDWKSQKAPFYDFPFLLEDMVFDSPSGKKFTIQSGMAEEGSRFSGIVIFLNTKEIQEMTGLKDPCWRIANWIWEVYEKGYFINVRTINYKGRDGGRRFEAYKSPHRFLDIKSKVIGKVSRRKNIDKRHTELVEFAFILDTNRAQYFLKDLLMGEFPIFPKAFYNKLKWGHQNFVRYVSKCSNFPWDKLYKKHPIKDIQARLNLKTKDIRDLKKSIERILDNLKERGFIKRWEALGRGWDTEYKIQAGFERELFLEGAKK